MESDIVEQARKRAISYRECGPSAEHTAAMLDELAFQVERLRAELAAAIKQRDEARRESCLWSLPKGVAWNDWMLARAKANAAERGWDCFEEGGGA